jgi:hypothetical protein
VAGKWHQAGLTSGRGNLTCIPSSMGDTVESTKQPDSPGTVARAAIRSEVASIQPVVDLERLHRSKALAWIDSGAPLFRTAKPAAVF